MSLPYLDQKPFLSVALGQCAKEVGIRTLKIAGGLPDFLTWESVGLPCFTPSVHQFVARMPTDFGGLPDLMTR